MLLRHLLLVPALAAFATSAAAAEPELQVTEVEIRGAQHIHPDRVRFKIEVRAGKTYTISQLNQAVSDDQKTIVAMRYFKNITASREIGPDGRTVKIIYSFAELPYVGDVRYETFERVVRRGYDWRPAAPGDSGAIFDQLGYFDRDKLKKLVDTKPGTYLDAQLLENDRQTLLQKLRDDGHKWARVTVETPERDGITTVIFRIDTGQEVEVGKVIIQGLPDGVSWRVFEPGVYNPAGLLNAVGRAYQADQVAFDEGQIVRTLQDLGWLDARLISTRREITDYVRPTEERRRHGPDLAPDAEYNDRVVLIYTVDPGERYRLGRVDFIGNSVATSAELREAFAMPEGAWFRKLDLKGDPRSNRRARDRDKALGAIERARRVMSNRGHARVVLRDIRQADVANHIINLTLTVEHEIGPNDSGVTRPGEGDIYRIGRVDVQGNIVTRDSVVRRGMALNPGDLWNDDQLDESMRQIERTGIFAGRSERPRPLRLDPEFPSDRPNQVDLDVEVDEKPTGSLHFELGYSSASGVFGSVGYQENNFDLWGVLTGRTYRGAGQSLSADVYASQDSRSISSTWTNPHLLDGPYEMSVTGYRSNNSIYEWGDQRLGGSVSFGRRFLRNDLALGLSLGYFDTEISNVKANANNEALDADGRGFYQNSLGLYQTWDRLNDRQLPTSGYILRANETSFGAPLPGSARYAELSGSADSYLPLYETDDGGVTYFRLQGRYKQIDGASGDEVPFYARYRGGGQAPRHRGFGDYDLGPKEINRNGYESFAGGTKDALITAEMSFPVMGTNDGIRIVTFADYGNVWGKDETPRLQDMRTAVGFGIRFPVQLPISLDFAWLLDRNPGDAASQIHFGFGRSF